MVMKALIALDRAAFEANKDIPGYRKQAWKQHVGNTWLGAVTLVQIGLCNEGLSLANWISNDMGVQRPNSVLTPTSDFCGPDQDLEELETDIRIQLISTAKIDNWEVYDSLTLGGLIAASLLGPDKQGRYWLPMSIATLLSQEALTDFLTYINRHVDHQLRMWWENKDDVQAEINNFWKGHKINEQG
jgi:hypothetical protein